MWTAVLVASVLAFALKFLGYVVPERWLAGPRTSRVTSALPIALLAALVGVQTLTARQGPSCSTPGPPPSGSALVALALRAPFIVVVLLAAGVAALLRGLGLG